MSKARRTVKRVNHIGDCGRGKIEAYDKFGKKIGVLEYYGHEVTDKTWITVRSVIVNPNAHGFGVGTKLYSKLCEVMTTQCPTIKSVGGAVSSQAALKARIKVFPSTKLLHHGEVITIDETLSKLLPKIHTKKGFEFNEWNLKFHVDAKSKIKGCKYE